MEFVRGNLAIRDHISDGRDLLLFEKVKQPGDYRFIGSFACDGFEYAMAPDKNGALRRVLIFQLRPVILGEEPEIEKAVTELGDLTLDELHRRAIEDANMQPDRKQALRNYIERSASVRAYVLKRANGVCESCNAPAPFRRSTASPILNRIICVGWPMVGPIIRVG